MSHPSYSLAVNLSSSYLPAVINDSSSDLKGGCRGGTRQSELSCHSVDSGMPRMITTDARNSTTATIMTTTMTSAMPATASLTTTTTTSLKRIRDDASSLRRISPPSLRRVALPNQFLPISPARYKPMHAGSKDNAQSPSLTLALNRCESEHDKDKIGQLPRATNQTQPVIRNDQMYPDAGNKQPLVRKTSQSSFHKEEMILSRSLAFLLLDKW